MNRLILGLVLVLALAAAVFAIDPPIGELTSGGVVVIDSWKVDDLLAEALVEQEGSLVSSGLRDTEHVSGFTITRGSIEAIIHQIAPANADDDPEYEVDFEFVPPDFWFIVADKDSGARELASIRLQGGVVLETNSGISLPETLGTSSRLRLSMQETFGEKVSAEDLEPNPPDEEGGDPTPATAIAQASRLIIHVIDPAQEVIFTTTASRGAPETGWYDANAYDPRQATTGMARGPADTAGYPLESINYENLNWPPQGDNPGTPSIQDLLDNPGAVYQSVAAGVTAEGFLVVRYPLTGEGDFPFDDDDRIFVLDRETQVSAAPEFSGQLLDPEDRATLRLLDQGATFAEVPLRDQYNPDLGISEPFLSVFPFGGTLDYDASTERVYEVVRAGGLEDVFLRTGVLSEGPDTDPLQFDGDPEPMFNNHNLIAEYPVRIQEIDADTDGTLYILTETLSDDAGQIYDNLYRISVSLTEECNFGFFPLAQFPTPPNRTVRGDYTGDGRTGASNVAGMINALRSELPPAQDPNVVGGALLFRTDVDADGRFDELDREQIITMNTTGAVGEVPLSDAPLSEQTPLVFDTRLGQINEDGIDFAQIHDIEVVDWNHDGFLDVAALASDTGGGTFLWLSQPSGGEEPPPPLTLPVDFAARDMVWLHLDDDNIIDVAMVDRPSTAEGSLRFYRNALPGALELRLTQPAGVSPRELITGFFNSDTRPDILIGNNAGGDNLQIFINRSPFVFRRTTWDVDGTPIGLALGVLDLDNPRLNNMAVGSNADSSLSIYQAVADSQVRTDKVDTAQQAVDVLIGRFAHDFDNLLDPNDVIVIGSPGVGSAADIEIFRSLGDGTVESSRQLAVTSIINARDGARADFNLDGADDIAFVGDNTVIPPFGGAAAGRLAVYATSLLNPSFNTALSDGFAFTATPAGGLFGDVEIGDLDGDQDPDIILSLINTPFGADNGVYILVNLAETVVRTPTGP